MPHPGADTLELERELRAKLPPPDASWLVRKRGYFYRGESSGYTGAKSQAGRYTEAEAKDIASIEPDCMSALRASEWPDDPMTLSPEVLRRLLDALASLRAEKEELRRERDEARAYAHEATKAITGLTPGGSEYFGKQLWKGGDYTADLPFCVERIRERMADGHQVKIRDVLLAEAGKALGLIEALDGLTLFNRDLGEDGDHAHQIGAAAAFSQAADMARVVATRIASLTAKETGNAE